MLTDGSIHPVHSPVKIYSDSGRSWLNLSNKILSCSYRIVPTFDDVYFVESNGQWQMICHKNALFCS